MKRPIKSVTTAITEVITQLVNESAAAQMLLCPAICSSCGLAWVLRKEMDSQYTRLHPCVPGARFNIRISIEPIGETKAERDKLSHQYHMAVR
jgi:hypothetical protein